MYHYRKVEDVIKKYIVVIDWITLQIAGLDSY